MPTRILAIDAGTTSVRAFIFDDHGRVVGQAQREFPQHFPQPGWVEHDPDDIWLAARSACSEALVDADVAPGSITCIGITNQRETTIVWDRATLRPVDNAIVWQDRRTAAMCEQLAAQAGDQIHHVTGLVVDAYFSATKLMWMLNHHPHVRVQAKQGTLAFGTVDSWLVAKMTAGQRHVTEPSNASRTMLFDVHDGGWSQPLLELMGVPAAMLPEVIDSADAFGVTEPDAFLGIRAPITGVLGDQQAALFGQGAWTAGMSKNTYGTGSFLLLNTGAKPVTSTHGLLTSVGWRISGQTTYVLEGAIFVTGASVQWLRDQLGVISSAAETAALAAQLPPGNDGVYLVPAFAGLGAPHWDPHARAMLIGLSRGSDRRHLARAALEAMAYQTFDVAQLMERESDTTLTELRADGGAATNDVLCQFQADVLQVPVLRPQMTETTVWGAAMLAGLGAGVWSSTDELGDIWQLDRRFVPSLTPTQRDDLLYGWHDAVARCRN